MQCALHRVVTQDCLCMPAAPLHLSCRELVAARATALLGHEASPSNCDAAHVVQVEAKAAGLANNSGALVLLLQLLKDKHSKQHCVCVANTQLAGGDASPDVQALEAALLLKELQVRTEMHDFLENRNLRCGRSACFLQGEAPSAQKGVVRCSTASAVQWRIYRRCTERVGLRQRCRAAAQGYAEHVQEWKDGAGLEDTSVG